MGVKLKSEVNRIDLVQDFLRFVFEVYALLMATSTKEIFSQGCLFGEFN